MVVLITSAMVIMTKVEQPYLNRFSSTNDSTFYETFAEHLLLTPGDPADWGMITHQIPAVFGLASVSEEFYSLDIDKVSRLNNDSIYSIHYADIVAGLMSRDISLNIKIHPVFNILVSLLSKSSDQNETTGFRDSARFLKNGLAITIILEHVQHSVQYDHIVLSRRFVLDSIRHHPAYVKAFSLCFFEHLCDTGLGDIHPDNLMAHSSDKESIAALAATQVQDQGACLVVALEECHKLRK